MVNFNTPELKEAHSKFRSDIASIYWNWKIMKMAINRDLTSYPGYENKMKDHKYTIDYSRIEDFVQAALTLNLYFINLLELSRQIDQCWNRESFLYLILKFEDEQKKLSGYPGSDRLRNSFYRIGEDSPRYQLAVCRVAGWLSVRQDVPYALLLKGFSSPNIFQDYLDVILTVYSKEQVERTKSQIKEEKTYG